MLVPMAKVEIIGPKNRFFDVVSLVHEQGTLHIEDLSRKIRAGEVPLDQMHVVKNQEAERERMEELLIRVRSILKVMKTPETREVRSSESKDYENLWKLDTEDLAKEIESTISEVEDRTASLASAQADIQSEIQLLASYEPVLHKIQPLAEQIVTTGSFDSVAILIERRYKGLLEQLKEELNKVTKNQCEIIATDVDEETTAAIVVFNRSFSEPVHKLLAMENLNLVRLPSAVQNMPFDEAYQEIKGRRQDLPQQLDRIRGQLARLSSQWYEKLAIVRDVLADKIAEIQAIPMFGQTEYAFVITGWMPSGQVSSLKKSFQERFGPDVIVDQLEIEDAEFEETPVALKNPKAMAPFQTLLAIYGMPKYGTLDPTWMLFLFYPLFFGMIVGDFGYGLIMLGIVLWARFKYRDNEMAQLVTSILGPAATMVVAFGLLYAEFFGDVMSHYLGWVKDVHIPGTAIVLPFHRTELAQSFLVMAVIVGFVHVVMGLVLGVINGIRTKHMSHVYERGGMLTMLLSAAFLGLLVALPVVSDALGGAATWVQMLAGAGVFIGWGLATKGGKMLGLIESISQFANVASYLRIMAVGLAGALFADAVNKIMAESGSPIAWILGLILHALNFVILAFSPTIHAIRLNFVEFFGKFYETGGRQYKPFQKTGGGEST